MKILLLNALEIYGGGELFVYLLSRYLNGSGFDVIVSCPESSLLNEKCRKEGIKIFNLDYPVKGNGNLTRVISGLKRIIRNENIDIVHSNTNYDRTAGAFATIGTGAVHAASIHSYYSIQRNLTHLIRNKFYIKHFIASGEKIRELLIKEDKINPERITSINLGIDINEKEITEAKRKASRKNFGIAEYEIVMGNVGRLVEFKGQENLIEAFNIIRHKYPETKLLIAGGGELESWLKRLCKEVEIEDKVIFTGFSDNLDDIYSAMDIYVHPSLPGAEELFPFAVLDAMAFGLPVIATDTGEIKEMVKENSTGFLLNDNKPGTIALAIEHLITNKGLLNSLGNEGNRLLKTRFTLGKMGKEVTDIYEKMLKT
ncbi:MAG: glycosyltransferase family 4 protein, partial [Ignavibacteria bacterium]